MRKETESENALSIATCKIENSKRKWNKFFFCTFCHKQFSKLPRHWYKKHASETEIAKILSFDKKSKNRKILILELQNRGTYAHNLNIFRTGKGQLIPKRRPHDPKHVKDFIPCQFCYQLFKKKFLHLHQRKCTFKKYTEMRKKGRSSIATNSLLIPVGPKVSSQFRDKILSRMNGDEVFQTVRKDHTILRFGEMEFNRLGHEARYHRSIIDRCRELGRLLLHVKKNDSTVTSLQHLLVANKYQLIKKSVMEIAGFNAETNTLQSPSLGLKVGISLKKCAVMLKGDFFEDDVLRLGIPKLDSFLFIMEAKWSREVVSHCNRTLNERKWNCPKRIPLAKDIQKLHKYLMTNSDDLRERLQDSQNLENFQSLVEMTLVMTIILNRRRVGEVQYMLWKDYEKASTCDPSSDVYSVLSETEKELSKSLIRLVIKGKRGRGVPVLSTKNLQKSINIIREQRCKYGIDETIPYLFPSIRHFSGHFEAHKLLRKFSQQAGCEQVESLTSTKLRKHVAVMVQLLNLKENELDSLAQFMGHNLQVHRAYYRLAEETMQLAKISKILINMEKGNLQGMKGKSLDEIDVDDSVEAEIDNDNEEEGMGEFQEVEFDYRGLPEGSSDTSHVDLQGSGKEIEQKELLIESCSYREEITMKVSDNFTISHNKKREDLSSEGIRDNKKIKNTAQAVRGLKKKTKPFEDQSETRVIRKRRQISRRPWSVLEKTSVINYFKNYITMKTVPGKRVIDDFLKEKGEVLQNRLWTNVKDMVYNEIKKEK